MALRSREKFPGLSRNGPQSVACGLENGTLKTANTKKSARRKSISRIVTNTDRYGRETVVPKFELQKSSKCFYYPSP